MGFFDGYNIATSGMSAQRTRINVVSENIANAQTTHTEEGGPYRKKSVVFEELLLKNDKKQDPTSAQNLTNQVKNLKGVGVKEILDTQSEPMMKYEPNHPEADESGYVAYPNINPVIEMVDLIEAMRSYESNLASFQTQKTMDTKTLDILRG